MKKYKQVLAALLAMNLTVYVMPTGVVKISASVESQSSENTAKENDTDFVTESVEALAVDGSTVDKEESTDSIEEASNQEEESDTTDGNSDAADVEITEDDISDTENVPDVEITGEDAAPAEEDMFSDGSQSEEAEAALEESSAQNVGESENTPHLAGFLNYSNGNINITSVQELILLSNCKPEELQNITITLSMSGETDLTSNSKIEAGKTDISKFYDPTKAAEDNVQQSNIESADSAEEMGEEISDTQLEETVQEIADTQSEEIVQEIEDTQPGVVVQEASGTQTDEEVQETPDVQSEETVQETQESEEDTAQTAQENTSAQSSNIFTSQDYTFQGIGTEAVPFQGEIAGSVGTIKIDKTFFGGLSSRAVVKATTTGETSMVLTWCGNGTVPMIAGVYQFDTDNSSEATSTDTHTFPVTVRGYETATMGSLIGTVRESDRVSGQTLIIGNVASYSSKTAKAEAYSGNTGLICNTLESGNICLDGYVFPDSCEIQNSASYDGTLDKASPAAGNAGGAIGVMKTGTTLQVNSAVNISATVTSDNGNAGGLAGLMEKGSRILTAANAAVTVSDSAITGGISAGGAVGTAEDVIFNDSDLSAAVNVKNVTLKATNKNAAAGGFVGKYTLNTENLVKAEGETTPDLKLPSQIKVESPTLTVSDSGLAGGYFGHLEINGKLSYTIGDTVNKKEINPVYAACSAEGLGAVAGKVTSTTIESTLLIQNIKITATLNGNNGINYHGGLIGEVGRVTDSAKSVYLKVSDTEINVVNPNVTENGTNGFGGVAGLLAQGSILKLENNVTVTTSDANGTAYGTAINQGGGIVGYAEKSVINLSGTTDLSKAGYQSEKGKNAKTGWLVGRQDCALIYAEGDGNGNGWTYIRGKETTSGKTAENDIGNYGQIIRLKSGESSSKLSSDLIRIDDDKHTVQYKMNLGLSGDSITISSEDEFALLSIAWISRGYFGGITGLTGENFSANSPKSKNIILGADIDLTGSGITGLSRDTKTDIDTYSGTFDGNGKTITLVAGETFGYKQSNTLAQEGEDGCGEVISAGEGCHDRQGLFAVAQNATFQNLTVKGTINISNAGQSILAGGIAAETKGEIRLSGATAEETINADCAVNQALIAGGFFGGSYGGSLQIGDNDNKTGSLNTASASINIQNCTNATDDTKIFAGGVAGEAGEKEFTFNADSLSVKGTITTSAKKRAYVGGLIGMISGYYVQDKNGNMVQAGNGAGESRTIKIGSIEFDGFKIDAPDASEVCGGLLGSIWSYVGVKFTGGSDAAAALNVKNAEINAPKAAYAGGLAYRSSGNWEIQDYGINLEKFTVNAKSNVGLLVCRGERAAETVSGNSYNFGALYLNTTKYWGTSYKMNDVSITTSSAGVFDEFVAYTTPSAAEIIDNGKNGIISIATEEKNGKRVGVDVSECTTYQNRTDYGKKHQTNAYSRYYYDLDQCLTDVAEGGHNNNKMLDTPQELLLWSVYNYAFTNIKTYFTRTTTENIPLEDITNAYSMPWAIGGGEVDLDMSKYSYYPIKFEGHSVNVGTTLNKETKLKFNNEEIQKRETEASNKSTQGTKENHTQHYGMHCGLFLTYQTGNTNTVPLTVRNVEFSGSIGKMNNETSGVLVADFASGVVLSNTIKTLQITIENITFDGLKVTDCGNNYAPLLINNIGDNAGSTYEYGHTTLNVNDVTVTGYDNEKSAVASSLIGKVGSSKAKQINMTFRNIVLPDQKANGAGTGIFSHATLLEHFAYSKDDNSSGATYNFYSYEDWEGETHTYNVTYGKEITDSTEFKDFQKWYYDEETYGIPEGLVYNDINNKEGFSSAGYLPYVYTAYNEQTCMHEIKVNQRVTDILYGCGTYEHPYEITTEEEMKCLAEYMSTGVPRKDWRVRVTKTQSKYHTATAAEDVIYQYDGSEWIQVKNDKKNNTDNWQNVKDSAGNPITIRTEFMRQYLLNSYYDIQGKTTNDSTQGYQLKLQNFGGFGTENAPFRGVIFSSTGVNVILIGEKTGNGLIPYSYGSVVRNLKISYQGDGKTLTYENSLYYPKVCFGGVIGCVMGGDNIIDGVMVNIADEWLTLDGEKKHLIQVGGYVGAVSGGGVIFRNMTDATGLTDTKITNVTGIKNENEYSYLYINPYVGRVLDGFAFYEAGSGQPSLDNTNKNYKINTLDTNNTDCITIASDTVTVKNAQGLLLLSAIVNSGAAASGGTNAFSSTANISYPASDKTSYNFAGKYGKVRNAGYTAVGLSASETESNASKNDDQTAPGNGNLPYLIQKYCGASSGLFDLSKKNGLKINLQPGGKFDMTGYGNGYQGIAARYVANAVRGDSENKPDGVVLEVSQFNGNENIVKVDMQVREYIDDDFHAASVGGVFNILRMNNNGCVSNVTITQNNTDKADRTADISLEYYSSAGKEAEVEKNWENYKKNVGAGGFAGSITGYVTGYEAEGCARDITFDNIQLNGLKIKSPASAGGIIGNSGKTVPDNLNKDNADFSASDIAVLLQPMNGQYTYGIAFNNCNYANLNIASKYAAGGFVGYLGNAGTNPRSSVNGDGFTEEVKNEILGQNSTISADGESSCSGGLFGYAGTRIFVNMTDIGQPKNQAAVLQNVAVEATHAAGGCIGKIDNKTYGIYKVTVEGTNTEALKISLNTATESYAGGIIGYADGTVQGWGNWKYPCWISNSSVKNVQINSSSDIEAISENSRISGGIAGYVACGGGEARIEDCTVNGSSIYGSKTAGISGVMAGKAAISNCTVQGKSSDSKNEISASQAAGGIIGFSSNGTNDISIKSCKVLNIKLSSYKKGCGGLLGDVDWNNPLNKLYLFDCKIEQTEVEGKSGNATAGGLTGDLRGTLTASNLLMSGMTISAVLENKVGMVIGMADSKTQSAAVAGLSIQNTTASSGSKTITQLYGIIGDNTATATEKYMKANSYFAFADYSGTAASLAEEDKENLLNGNNTAITDPYVVIASKNSTLKLYEDENASAQYLYGDGASWTAGSKEVKAKEIWTNRNTSKNGHYAYSNISNDGDDSVEDFEFDAVISTYSDNQRTQNTADTSAQAEAAQTTSETTDFPVVQVSAGNADIVKDYLNILTNGAFSAANNMNTESGTHVTANVDVYTETKDGRFVKDSDASPAFKANTDKTTGKITFSTTTDYDNGRKRFNLLTVTFKETDADGKTTHSYNVFVPVLVRRMLEMDFTATLTYGTDFRSSDYAQLNSHILESFGSSITGYLNYTYNSANGVYTDYGWESYINAGGDMMEMQKSIRFTHGTTLPEGTQLSLVDCRNGKVYYYTAEGKQNTETGAEKINGSDVEVPLRCFVDSDGNSYQEPSISELIGAVASTEGSNKLFVQVDENGKPLNSEEEEDGTTYEKPTVKIKKGSTYEYYRLAAGDEKGEYAITVPAGKDKDADTSNIKENYYLVITIPKTDALAETFLNGSIQTTVSSKIPHQIHYRKLVSDDNGYNDTHNNTASTYLLSSGYTHSLKEETEKVKNVTKEITMSDSTLQIDVTDTITFPNRQIYNTNDQLYLKITGGLQKTTGDTSSAEQFPSGTTGEVQFYVYTKAKDGTKTYYVYDSTWKLEGTTQKPAMSYTWTSDGGNMELLLSANGRTAVSLQGLRTLLCPTPNDGTTTFYVEAVMNAAIPGAGLDVIPESALGENGQPEDFVKLTYSSRLSTESGSLDYSTNRASDLNTQTKYYRKEPAGVKLAYEADKIDQLGINLLDLQSAYLDAEKKHTFINTTATYDLSSMKNLADTLKNSGGIRFTLKLEQKMDKEEDNSAAKTDGTTWKEQYKNPSTDAEQYLSVELNSQDSGIIDYENGTWSWTIPKETYYADSKKGLRTDSVFDGNKLTQAILLKVDVTNIEYLNHVYSNYMVVLSAEILDQNENSIADTLLSDNIIYTLARIKPEFVDVDQNN